MQNSLVTHLRGYVEAMFKDIAFDYRRTRDWERDKARLLHELEFHGPRILTVSLPALCKHLDKCLANGLYTPSNIALGRCWKGSQVPVFLRDLYLQIFSREGVVLETPSVLAVDAVRQLLLGCKKIELPCPAGGVVNEIKSFINVEARVRHSSLDWELDVLGSDRASDLHFADFDSVNPNVGRLPSRDASILSAVADRISASFGDLSLEKPDELPRHGPGVVADLKKGVSKYSFTDWPTKLDLVFPYDLYATTDFGSSKLEDHELSYRNREVPSRLIAVPKDLTKPRLIAAEPSQHQWIQQLVRSQLEARLLNTCLKNCVSFRDQGLNKRFAIEGSRTGRFATIDLSAASDRLSCAVVERFFRTNPTILDRLHACRTRWLRIDIERTQACYLTLKKFAPMGSAVTFPVQSIVYAGIAIASVLITRGWKLTSANMTRASKLVTVYGDDIIVPTDCCRKTIGILETLGLKVNVDKTYESGYFRESCGVEAFKGTVVSPARVLSPTDRASLGNLSSLLQTSNNFWKRGWWHTAKWLESTFTDYRKLLPVVGVGCQVPGLLSFCGTSLDHLSSRRSKTLHRNEVKVMKPHNKVHTLQTDGPHRLFQYFIERPAPDLTTWESGTRDKTVVDMRPGWADVLYFLADSNISPSEHWKREELL